MKKAFFTGFGGVLAGVIVGICAGLNIAARAFTEIIYKVEGVEKVEEFYEILKKHKEMRESD